MIKFFLTRGWRFDTYQFYFGESFAGPYLWDVKWLKFFGKKVFFYFCGCDVRDSKATIEKYDISACKACWPMACSANRKKALKVATQYADKVFVSTPDLLEFVPGSVWLPQPISENELRSIRNASSSTPKSTYSDNRVIKIAHAPSNRVIKGTIYLENAITELKQTGFNVELVLVENKPYVEALKICSTADIVVDQLLVGSYGQFSVEMMALGKPVICYIREDLLKYYPEDLPLINATPLTILSVLKELIQRHFDWPDLGHKGIKYVTDTHSSKKVAQLTLDYYEFG